jgi:hypothetical protein
LRSTSSSARSRTSALTRNSVSDISQCSTPLVAAGLGWLYLAIVGHDWMLNNHFPELGGSSSSRGD